MVRTVCALAILVLSLVPLGARPADQPPIEINAIESLTGPAAFTGLEEQQTINLLTSIVNREGGIRGRPLKVNFTDDESNPQIAVQLMSRYASAHDAVVFGPGFTATCQAALPVVDKSGPLMICGSPGLVAPPGSYGIAGGPTVDDAMLALMRYFRDRGWTRIGVLASTDASGQAYVHGIQAAALRPEMKDVQIVALERMNVSDISVAGQLTRNKAANPTAVFTLATGTPWGTMMRGLNDAGMTDLPIGGGHGNINYNQLKQYQAFLPKEVYFPGIIALAPGGVGAGPIKDAQTAYFAAFKSVGLRPDLSLNVPWDPVSIVIGALRKFGPDVTAQQLRDYVVNLHGYVGVNGVYDFRDGKQRGVGVNALIVDRYDNAKETLTPVSRPGGALK